MKKAFFHLVYLVIICLLGSLAVMSNRMVGTMAQKYIKLSSNYAALSSKLSRSAPASQGQKVDLSKVIQNNFDIEVWANLAAVSTYNFNFKNYQARFNRISQFYLPQTWEKVKTALNTSGLLNLTLTHKMIVSSVAQGPVIIKKQGVVNGRYQWDVLIPILVLLNNGEKTIQQKVILKMIIARVAPPSGVNGLAVLSFNATNSPI